MAAPSSRKRATQTQTPRRQLWVWLAGTIAVFAALAVWAGWSLSTQADNSIGNIALDDVKALVAFGPRPAGSEAHRQMERYIEQELQRAGLAVEEDTFTAQTPIGPVPMKNIIGRIGRKAGSSGRVIVLASHYDTKLFTDIRFVGANDGGSSTGLLLALAPVLSKRKLNHEVWLVFLDGEEDINARNVYAGGGGEGTVQNWSDDNSLFGSRELAAKWKADGTAARIGAFILVDMIGDNDVQVLRDANSTRWLEDQIWSTAQRLGYSHNFLNRAEPIDDDHMPFVHAGIPSVDLIDDFTSGPFKRYWHTAGDTLDILSARSLQIIAEVVLATVSDLDRQQ